MKETIAAVWNNWYFQDLFVLTLVVTLVVIGRALGKREFWRVAFREVFQRTSIKICFAILCLYTAVAVLDSVGYHPYLRDKDNKIEINAETGCRVKDPVGLSCLDAILSKLKNNTENAFSAPLSDREYTKMTFTDDEGNVVRDYKPLQHKGKHLLGTDRIGSDVFYLCLKGIRTGMVIGALTTLLVIPFAIFFGVMAGYFGGWVDDIVQYIYTTLSSIPGILLIVAFMVLFENPGLPQLVFIMGITSWTGLCRVLRGETMKLREAEYVQACEAMGVSRAKIMIRHIVPNLMHLVLITIVLGFSGRVLAEVVLSYIGISVGADTVSWGSMITGALPELSRDPAIWWQIAATFVFMLGLILPANLFGDALRDALDPRLRTQ